MEDLSPYPNNAMSVAHATVTQKVSHPPVMPKYGILYSQDKITLLPFCNGYQVTDESMILGEGLRAVRWRLTQVAPS